MGCELFFAHRDTLHGEEIEQALSVVQTKIAELQAENLRLRAALAGRAEAKTDVEGSA